MRIRLLGPIEVEADGVSAPVRAEKQQLVLAALALDIGEVVSSDRLVELLWGEELPADPANSLQYQVSQVRKALGDSAASPMYLHRDGNGYRLDPGAADTDVRAMRAAVDAARERLNHGAPMEALESVDAALELWRGPSLGDLAYSPLAAAADDLDAERADVRELRTDALLALDRLEDVLRETRALAGEHPLREGLWLRLVKVLYRLGRQTEALRGVQAARDTLAEVGLEPSADLVDLEQRILQRDPTLVPAGPELHNFPAPPNRLIGRDDDLAALDDVLNTSRMVTVVGAGGAGKTRIAVEVGRARAGRYAGGAWLVRLDTLDDPDLVGAEVGRVLGMREDFEQSVRDTLAAHIGAKQMLVVLDNCEHVLDAVAALVEDLVALCPALTVLATSQVVLGVAAERVFDLAPLAVPGETSSIYDPLAMWRR